MSGLPPDPTGLGSLLGDPEVRKMVGDLVARKLRADLAAIRGGAELLGRWRIDRDGAGPAGSAPPGDGVIKELVRLHLEYYTALVNMTAEFHERTRALLGAEPAAEPEPARPDPEMHLTAPPGSTARGAFRVENTTSSPITVELVASPFHRDGTDETAHPPVAFDPPRVELTPGQEAQVTALVPVGDELAPGATYRATISAAGVEAVRIAVRLDVEPPAAKPTRPTTAKKPAAAKRTAPKKPAGAAKPAAGRAAKKPAATRRRSTARADAPADAAT